MTSLVAVPLVSVIVITFNQDLPRLTKTLESIIIQEGVSFEIIICDDGSKKRYENELRNYFSIKNFCNYSLIFHDQNEGTVSNYYSGLQIAKGKYSKLISPGDCLAEKRTLYKWVRFMEENHAEWSFSDTYYYHIENDNVIVFRAKAMPHSIRPYIMSNRSKCIWNYVALSDIANGAAIIGMTHTQLLFCKIIKDKGIKYCEDTIYRLMMFYGIVGSYFPEAAIFYEYGSGISTPGNAVWQQKITADKKILTQIMLNEKEKSYQQQRMAKAMIWNYQTCKLGKLFIRGKLLHWLKSRIHPRLTPVPKETIRKKYQ